MAMKVPPPPPPPPPRGGRPPPPPPLGAKHGTPAPPGYYPRVPPTPHPPPAAPARPNLLSATNYVPSKRVDFVCPFCMRGIYTGDLLYLCKACKRTFSEADAQKEGLGRVVKKQYYHCNSSITGNRVCPNCKLHAEQIGHGIDELRVLPSDVYDVRDEFRLCMTGYSRSGKTQYITQLMDFLTKNSLPGIDSTFFLDTKTKQIKDLIRHRLFVGGVMPNTPSGYLDPLLFDIRRGKRSYVSVFYDIAGEDFAGLHDTMATRCIWTSNNIILVIDPTTLPGVQDHPRVIPFKYNVEDGTASGKASDGEVVEPLNSYLVFIRDNQPKWEKYLKHVNMAVVFPKMDLFYGDYDFPQILKDESSHILSNRFDIREAEAVTQAMSSWLREKEGGILVQTLSSFPNARLFGLSSGSDDLSRKSVTNRLLDPYLWLLYQNGILQ